jgi:hypothetical protein
MANDQPNPSSTATQDRTHQPGRSGTTPGRGSHAAWVRISTIAAAASVLVSGYIHFYLYFRGGYRSIHPESVFGLTISRSFALNAIAGLIIAEALVLSLRRPALAVPVALATLGFAATTLGAYTVSHTTGLLGFTETRTTAEVIIALVAEVTAIVAALGLVKTMLAPSIKR